MQPRTLTAAQRHVRRISYSPNLDRAHLRGQAAVSQMADDMRLMTANAGCVTEDDMKVLGWTRGQIATLGDAARNHAYAQSAS